MRQAGYKAHDNLLVRARPAATCQLGCNSSFPMADKSFLLRCSGASSVPVSERQISFTLQRCQLVSNRMPAFCIVEAVQQSLPSRVSPSFGISIMSHLNSASRKRACTTHIW